MRNTVLIMEKSMYLTLDWCKSFYLFPFWSSNRYHMTYFHLSNGIMNYDYGNFPFPLKIMSPLMVIFYKACSQWCCHIILKEYNYTSVIYIIFPYKICYIAQSLHLRTMIYFVIRRARFTNHQAEKTHNLPLKEGLQILV